MSKFNKVITNVPVPLDETEVENLSQTLSGLLNGGGGEGKIYEGDGVYIDVDNTHITGKITLTQTAKTKLDTPIPTQVADLTDSANYETTEHANATYLTKSSADTLYAPLSVSGDIEYLSGEFNNYYKKTETSSKEQLSDEFEKYVTENTFYGAVEELENEKQNKLTFGYNSESAISSINGSALAGKETTPYDYGTDLIIDEYTIKVNTNGTANNFGMSFVEGKDTKAAGAASHAEGKETSAMSDYSHTEGYKNIDYEIPGQIGSNHIEGAYNNVSGVYTHIEGHANGASGYGLHIQGGYNRFYINNTAADITHSDPTDRWNIWGISIEGMANATTAEPISGYDSEGHPLYVHGGILKVIGNGTRTKQSEDPSSESITRSDALIIYRDGCISAAGKISANGIELGSGGGGTSYQGRNGVDVNGGYVELTTTAYNAVTSVSSKVDKPTSMVDKYLALRTDNDGNVSGWVDLKDNFYSKSEADGRYQKKTDMSGYLTTEQYATDSATFVTETELETVSGEITALIPTNYVTSGDYISGDSQYALTTAGWAVVKTGDSLTANSGININNNLINVALGANLKFDYYSQVATEDNIRVSSVRAGYNNNQYTIVNDGGIESYVTSDPDSQKLTLTTFGLNNTLEGGNRCITANYDLNHLFFKSYDNNGTYSGDYSQVEVKVMQETAPAETQHRSSITLTDYYGGVEHTGLITVEKIAQWDQGGGGTSFTGVVTGTGLSGNGLSNSPLGIDTTAAIYFTNASAKSAVSALSAEDALSSRYAKQLKDASKVIEISAITALQDWASSNSSTWDSVTANLTSNKVFVSGTNFDTLGQSRIDGNSACYGTNWMGVSQSHAGFLKYIDGQSVGDTEISNAGSGIQIEFKPNSTQGDLNIINTYTGTQTTTKVINVPTASYTNMSTFDSENGPNYMLRKTANGFDIGAAVINTTALPDTVQANAYYFIYEM